MLLGRTNCMSSINEIFIWIAQNIQITLTSTNMEQGIIVVIFISWVFLGQVCRFPLMRNALTKSVLFYFLCSTWSYWKHLQLCLSKSHKNSGTVTVKIINYVKRLCDCTCSLSHCLRNPIPAPGPGLVPSLLILEICLVLNLVLLGTSICLAMQLLQTKSGKTGKNHDIHFCYMLVVA